MNSAVGSRLIALAIFVSSFAHAQTNSAPKTAGLLNQYLRTNNPALDNWDFGGQIRIRGEHKEYFASVGADVDFAARGDANNTYLLLREKVHVGYTPEPWLNMFVEGRDSSSQLDDRDPNPDSDAMDLYQGYVRLGGQPSFPFSLKVGRQELTYGDELLIGRADFSNIPRSFDAIKARYENGGLKLDAFTARRVIARANAFNQGNDRELFSGVYADAKDTLPRHDLQLYVLARNVESRASDITVPLNTIPSPRDIYTVGGRIESFTNTLPGWDYNVEGAYQFGRFKNTLTSPSETQDAFAAHFAGGFTWNDAALTPRIGVEYNFASGDDNPNDRTHGTFDNLFPSNHRPYGLMDFVGWQNIHDACFTTLIHPVRNLSITNEVHGFWLADTHDFFYNVSGVPRKTGGYGIKPGAGQFVGTEYDFLASYNISTFANIQLGYGHFFVGEYVRNSLAPVGGAKDANWVYAQVKFEF
ncbi:MAG: alginate export family protein [Limisphaerales bacterium]